MTPQKLLQSPSPSSLLGFGAIALAATLWATAAIVASYLFQSGVTPFQLASARAVITMVGLGAIYYSGNPKPLRIDWQMGLFGMALALVTVSYYIAISRLPVAIALVIQYTAPALVVTWEAVRRKRFPRPSTVAAVVSALVGVALVSGLSTGQLKLDGVGLIAAGFSALFCAIYMLLSGAMVNTYGTVGMMFRGFLVSGLFWSALQITQGWPAAIFRWSNLPGVLFVGIAGTLIPFCLLAWGIQQVNAERGAIAATLEPVVAAVLAWIWLSQSLTLLQILGGGLVLAAVLSLQVRHSD